MVERPPQRTCVGCRGRAAKHQLLRVVAAGGVLVPDPRGRLPGRGAYLHPALACLDLAERRRAFPRALRVGAPLDTARCRTFLAETVSAGGEDARAGSADAGSAGRDAATRDGSMKS